MKDFENEDFENESYESEGSEFDDEELVGASRLMSTRNVAHRRAANRAMTGGRGARGLMALANLFSGLGKSGGRRRRLPIGLISQLHGGALGQPQHEYGPSLTSVGGRFRPPPRRSGPSIGDMTRLGNLGVDIYDRAVGRGGRRGMSGGAFMDDFMTGFNSVMKPGMQVLKPIMALAGPEGVAAAALATALGYGKKRGGRRGMKRGGFGFNDLVNLFNQGQQVYNQTKPVISGLKGMLPLLGDYGTQASNLLGQVGYGKRRGRKARGGSRLVGAGGAGVDGRTARAQVVREVMAERGMTLAQASKTVKEEGLY